MPQRGDIVLYKAGTRLYEKLIASVTHGPYVHVAIVVDDSRVIAANTSGIGYDDLPAIDDMHTLISLAGKATPTQIELGMMWATLQTGKQYGWVDILAQAVKWINPNNTLQIVQTGRWDCSDFACRYMRQVGIVLPDGFNDPYSMTPNDIARAFDIIPLRKNMKVAS